MDVNLDRLRFDWYQLYNNRNLYLCGVEKINLKDFKNLAEKTFEAIKYAKEEYIYNNKYPDNISMLFVYMGLLNYVSAYALCADAEEDESADRTFTATCLVAKGLSFFSGTLDPQIQTENGMKYVMDEEVASGTIYENNFDLNPPKRFRYNFHEGDFSEFIELAKSL